MCDERWIHTQTRLQIIPPFTHTTQAWTLTDPQL